MLKQLVERFTSVPLLGVDVGSTTIKVVELAHTEGGVALRRCGVAAIDKTDTPASVLKSLIESAGFGTTDAAVGIASPNVVVKRFEFPPMPKKELDRAIRLEAEQVILNGHTMDQIAVDWHPMGTGTNGTIQGILSVAPKTVVKNRLATLKASGLRAAVVDVEALALWNTYWALVGSREAGEPTVLLVNVGAATTNLVIAKGPDQLVLIRDLQVGARDLEKGSPQADWVAEVRDSLGYARSQGGLRLIDAVYVTGGGSGPALLPLLKATVPQASLTFWNPLKQLGREEGAPAIEESVGPLLAIAIGLALRHPS